MNQKVTVLIPTKNRSEFLIRLLHYYSDLGFQGTICIGDGSDTYHAERIKEAIKSLEGKVTIHYQSQPNLNYRACTKNLIGSVSTPYTALNMDDDFLVPNGLKRCVEFLESHPDYSAAHGLGAMFSLDSKGPYGKLSWVGPYAQRAIEAATARQRLVDYFAALFVSVFSVHRTEAWRVMCQDVVLQMDWCFADEMLPCCLAVIHGKIKELDCFYLAFQNHDQRTRAPDFLDRITSPTWGSSYQIFRDCVAKEVARQDGVSVEEAREVVKQVYWSLLAKGLTRSWEARYAPRTEKPRSTLRDAVGRVPGLRRAWRATRSVVRRKADEISLPALLRPSSPYHTDFMRVYKAVSNPRDHLRESASLSDHLGPG